MSALSEVHHPESTDDKIYPYRTQALLGTGQWKKVTVLGPARTIAVSVRVKGCTGMKLVTVQVDGERVRRRIAFERLWGNRK